MTSERPDQRTVPWQAFECLPAKPGSWCVGADPQTISGISTDGDVIHPTVFITPWGLDEATARQIADEHNQALATPALTDRLAARVSVWLYMAGVNLAAEASGNARAGGWAAAQCDMSREVLDLLPVTSETDALREALTRAREAVSAAVQNPEPEFARRMVEALPHAVPIGVLRSLGSREVFADLPRWKVDLLIAQAWNAALDDPDGARAQRRADLARRHASERAALAAAHASEREAAGLP